MTPREKNLWGLIAGLVLAISLGVYKVSHAGPAVVDESPSAESAGPESDEPVDENAADAGAYMDEGETDRNATDMAATDMYTEEEAKHEIQAPQNLLPENATDAAAVQPPTQRVVSEDQPEGGEE